MKEREAMPSPLVQVEDEMISYSFDWSANGTPITPSATLIIENTDVDISATNLVGVASIIGNRVITPQVVNLNRDVVYRLRCFAVIGGNTLCSFIIIKGQK